MDENISQAAGADHGTEVTAGDFRRIVEPLGRTLVQRTPSTAGRTSRTFRSNPPAAVGSRSRSPGPEAARTRQALGDGYGLEVTELNLPLPHGRRRADAEIISLLRHVDGPTANSFSS